MLNETQEDEEDDAWKILGVVQAKQCPHSALPFDETQRVPPDHGVYLS